MSYIKPLDKVRPAELDEALLRQLKTLGRFYLNLVQATLDHFGDKGEMTIRRSVRRFGHWRGREMRDAHSALGYEINMETLMKNWDAASTHIVPDDMDSGSYSPNLVVHDVSYCPAAEVWKAGGFHRWGHVYCDEFHHACASTYHPDGHVVIHENMMKGDPACKFRWVMPPAGAEDDAGAGEPGKAGAGAGRQAEGPGPDGGKLASNYEAADGKEASLQALKRTWRLIGGFYQAFALQLQEDFGEQGLAAFKDGIRRWGEDRGRILREEHESRGLQRTPAALIRHSDVGYQYLSHIREVEAGDNSYTYEEGYSPFLEALEDYGVGHLGEYYFSETIDGMARAYVPGGRASLDRYDAGSRTVTITVG